MPSAKISEARAASILKGPQKPTFVDLFSGCGGASLGFLWAGFQCLLAVDNNPLAVRAYNRNLQGQDDAGCFMRDLATIKTHAQARALLQEFGIKPGDVDVLIGCPPCQSFSVAGANKIRALMDGGVEAKQQWQAKNAQRNKLFEALCLIAEVLKPQWIFFENVPAITSHAIFPEIVHRFETLSDPDTKEELGFRVCKKQYLASDYGVPQSRRRFVLIAHRDPNRVWTEPRKENEVTVGEALSDLPGLKNGDRHDALPYVSRAQNAFQARMRSGLFEPHYGFVYDCLCRAQNEDDVALFREMAPSSRFADDEVQAAMRKINPNHKLAKYAVDKFKDKLHRLDQDRQAWTVTAHLRRDCYKFIHPWQPRTISVREAARLQSFPDWYRFDVLAMIIAYEVIGNAVPPLMARAFANSILEADPELVGRQHERA